MLCLVNWQKRAALSILLLLAAVSTSNAWGSPKDIRGSGNVAVSGYTNSAGHFLLWSSGRITNSAGKEVNSAAAYDAASVCSLPSRINGNILGSVSVAVSVFSDSEATYVLFSDGTVKKPRNSAAAAPAASNEAPRVVTGVNVKSGSSKSGQYGWSCRAQASSSPYYLEVTFNKKFTRVPVVLVQCTSYHEAYPQNTITSADEKDVRIVATASGFKIYFHAPDSKDASHRTREFIPDSISFIAHEDVIEK